MYLDVMYSVSVCVSVFNGGGLKTMARKNNINY